MSKNKTFGILFIVTIIFLSFTLRGKLSGEKFDSKKWKNWTESEMELSSRWDMMNSLRNNHDLKGKTKKEISRRGQLCQTCNKYLRFNFGRMTPKEIIQCYDLSPKAKNGDIYMEICLGICGLP